MGSTICVEGPRGGSKTITGKLSKEGLGPDEDLIIVVMALSMYGFSGSESFP